MTKKTIEMNVEDRTGIKPYMRFPHLEIRDGASRIVDPVKVYYEEHRGEGIPHAWSHTHSECAFCEKQAERLEELENECEIAESFIPETSKSLFAKVLWRSRNGNPFKALGIKKIPGLENKLVKTQRELNDE